MSQTKHSRQVIGGDCNVLQAAAARRHISQRHTQAPDLQRHCFIHHQPSIPLSFRHPLPPRLASHFGFFQTGRGGGG